MPTKNRVKMYAPDTYYHLYNRGWNRTAIFQEDEDYVYFEWLIARHISPEPTKDSKGREYRHLGSVVDLVAYCLMPNHFHMLIYQYDEHAITQLMSSVLTSYTMYFNKKYKRRGSLFESTYKAVMILEDAQLMHATRYIHLNHRDYKSWPFSSYVDYSGASREWLKPQTIIDLFPSRAAYLMFVDDHEDAQREYDRVKAGLANS